MSRSKFRFVYFAPVAIVVAVVHSPAFAAETPSHAQRRLESAGIDANREGIRKYLKSLLPNANRRKEIAALIAKLGHKVIEYDRGGNVVWSKSGLSNPAQAQRIANGNTLVSDNSGLHEFNPQGKEVWHYRTSRGKFHRF